MNRHDFNAMQFAKAEIVNWDDMPVGTLLVRRSIFEPAAPSNQFIVFPPEQAADAEREVCRRFAESN